MNRTVYPSFVGRTPASQTSAKAKRANRKTNTRPEIALRRALWSAGLRYRKHVRNVAGVPDVVFVRARVAVFCDGDFWHGRNFITGRDRLLAGANGDYWCQKIEANMTRDAMINEVLLNSGWTVVRLWGSDVVRHPSAAVSAIEGIVSNTEQTDTPQLHQVSV